MKHSFDLVTKPLDSLLFEKENPNCSLYLEDGYLWVSGDLTKEQAQKLLDAHNPPDPIVKENEAKALLQKATKSQYLDIAEQAKKELDKLK